jgi:hypothetical protein
MLANVNSTSECNGPLNIAVYEKEQSQLMSVAFTSVSFTSVYFSFVSTLGVFSIYVENDISFKSAVNVICMSSNQLSRLYVRACALASCEPRVPETVKLLDRDV